MKRGSGGGVGACRARAHSSTRARATFARHSRAARARAGQRDCVGDVRAGACAAAAGRSTLPWRLEPSDTEGSSACGVRAGPQRERECAAARRVRRRGVYPKKGKQRKHKSRKGNNLPTAPRRATCELSNQHANTWSRRLAAWLCRLQVTARVEHRPQVLELAAQAPTRPWALTAKDLCRSAQWRSARATTHALRPLV